MTEEHGEELPNELEKLEISTTLQLQPSIELIESNITETVFMNPFYLQSQETHSKNRGIKELFGPKCSICRIRRNSESVLESTTTRTLSFSNSERRRIQNCSQFKHKNILPTHSGRRLIRDPILKSIQKCFHKKSCLKSLKNNSHDDLLQQQDCQTLEALNLDDLTLQKSREGQKFNMKSSSILDFRGLIEQCHSIAVSNRNSLNNSTSNSLGLKLTNTKNFNTIQTSEVRSNQKSISKSSRSELPKNSSNAAASSSSSSSTSCSQQARINASSGSVASTSSSSQSTAPCDVTIDELASYFETFVHIPKKMSSMAEMMYI